MNCLASPSCESAAVLTVKAQLQNAFQDFKPGQPCALLNYPDHINIGDHLIWAGAVCFLREHLQAHINYAASSTHFSPQRLQAALPEGPILLHGGGSLGDLWYSHQQFREHIIQTHPHRPIVILPQSLYFQKADNLAKAARIFNAHPDLTIFARDDRSFAIATQAFDACRVLKAPDMAFYLTQLAAFPVPPSSPQSILYHCRRDSELDPAFLPEQLGLSNLQVKDWHAYEDRWLLGHPHSPLRQRIARGIRAVWQRGLQHPHEWQSRQIWQRHYTPSFANCYQPELHQLSWSFIHSGIYQMRQYRAVITNRLHGHIFCVLLGIPHIFLPNAYYKNAAFYHSWTAHIPYCRFVTEPDDVKPALEALLAEAPSPTPSNYPPSAGRSRG